MSGFAIVLDQSEKPGGHRIIFLKGSPVAQGYRVCTVFVPSYRRKPVSSDRKEWFL